MGSWRLPNEDPLETGAKEGASKGVLGDQGRAAAAPHSPTRGVRYLKSIV